MTTFRRTLLELLGSITAAQNFDDLYAQFGFVDGKTEVLNEIAGYYTNELLEFGPFKSEFQEHEIDAIKEFVRMAESVIRGHGNWQDIKEGAGSLLSVLNRPT